MPEKFVIKLTGGPRDGTLLIAAEWPLPAEIAGCDGKYVKLTESALLPQEAGTHLARGAWYQWVPAK